MNPEQLLEEATTAIKHRTISPTFKWYIVYYYNRITCVPTNVNVPPEIILSQFAEQAVQDGFNIKEWATLKTRLIEVYEELHK